MIPDCHHTELAGVRAVNGHNVWAVGSYSLDRDTRTFIDHFNGTEWQQTRSPHPGNYHESRLLGIDAIGAGKAYGGRLRRFRGDPHDDRQSHPEPLDPALTAIEVAPGGLDRGQPPSSTSRADVIEA